MDATRPTRVGFDPRVERICSHTVAAFDSFRFHPDFNQSTPLCRCRMDATRPTRVGFDPRVERICSHTVAAFDAFRFCPDLIVYSTVPLSDGRHTSDESRPTPRCRCRTDATRPTRVGFDPRVERIRSHTVAAFDAFRFSPGFYRILDCAVVGRTPHVRQESGSIPVLSAFAHIRLPLSTPSVFLPSTPLCRCRTDATRPTRVGFDPRVERICSHTVAAFDAFRFSPGFYRLLRCAVVGWTPHVRRESGSIPVLSAFAHIRLPLSTPSVFLPSTPLCRCRRDATRPTRVGFDPRVERICSHTVAAFDAFRFSPDFNRLLHCAVVGWTPHVRRESGSIRVLSAFAHIRLPLSTPSVFHRILSSTPLCRCRTDATRPTRVGFDPRVERICSHTVADFDAFRFSPGFYRLLHCAVVGWTPHVRRESGSIPVLSAFAHIRLPLSTPSVLRSDFIVYSTVPLSDGRHTSDESRVRSAC
ncbi:hypothetical protein KIN20_036625 [Parelaphostrongylus tenuis]|uniref:Uncharacterized protein n=1 Tax=Parelaphostrongylus tenuis TaxID=148309 RepID=A0AAD5RDA8_PARTN|nr:hypothetical protein KIN20_036625 [Parelaphostrongylus tenuis]